LTEMAIDYHSINRLCRVPHRLGMLHLWLPYSPFASYGAMMLDEPKDELSLEVSQIPG